MPFAMLNGAFDGLYPPGDQWYWRADFVKEIPDEAVERNVEYGREAADRQVDHAHVPDRRSRARRRRRPTRPGATATPSWAQVMVGVDPDPAQKDLLRRWAVGYWEALHPYSAGGAYVNFMMDEGQERVQATYRDNYPRLAQVKAAYDPNNVFRVNQNIQPAA